MLREAKSGETLEIPPLISEQAGMASWEFSDGTELRCFCTFEDLTDGAHPLPPHVLNSCRNDRWSSAEQTSRILNWSSSSPRQAWRLARAACPEAPHRSPRRRLKKRTQQDIKMLKRWDTKCVRLFKSVPSDTLNAEEASASLSHTQSKRNWEEESSHYVTS